MKTASGIILDYLSSFNDSIKNDGPVKSFLDGWLYLTLLAQINLNKHSYKNKNDRDKLDFLFKDYGKNIAMIFKDKGNLSNLENIHSIVESGCPILITKFDDIKEAIGNIDKILEIASSNKDELETKELDYFMECLAGLIHLGKNKLFKSFRLDPLSGNYEDYDIKFSENAARLIFSINRAVIN
ncbi:MAG: hypothetical protein M0016_04150 [Deltaproteobacteria bacterium]|jgi:hypothetical protein|nr:hypothetical protein [Deltaproteobacteria bacterium]MCL5879940.1 hypothetical protein [Deltaproteobacteria bacterium]MDA8304341.1 hypothetical protein [Deltaproteobacteria bacterium]